MENLTENNKDAETKKAGRLAESNEKHASAMRTIDNIQIERESRELELGDCGY